MKAFKLTKGRDYKISYNPTWFHFDFN
jgi:hypothetical protein